MKNSKLKQLLKEEHSGAVAFEYVIILVIMAVAIFGAWDIMGDEIVAKAQQVVNFIKGNGQTTLSNT